MACGKGGPVAKVDDPFARFDATAQLRRIDRGGLRKVDRRGAVTIDDPHVLVIRGIGRQVVQQLIDECSFSSWVSAGFTWRCSPTVDESRPTAVAEQKLPKP